MSLQGRARNTITTSVMSKQIALTDGRKLVFSEYGQADGKPVLFMHGFPGSRLDWLIFDPQNSAAQFNLRIIAVDRPGLGMSDYQHGRELLDWPADIVELMAALQLAQAAVLAISGGGPYGLACAYKIPERVQTTVIVCGMGPADASGMKEGNAWTLPGKPSLIRWLLLRLMVQTLSKQPERVEKQFLTSLSEPDRELLTNQPEILQRSLGSWQEAFHHGIGGVQREADLFKRPWGFQLQEISGNVFLWHGKNDKNVPGSVGHYVAEAIPHCQATFLEDEGHFTLPFNHLETMLQVLVN